MLKVDGIKMVLLIIDERTGKWKEITQEEKKLLPEEERIKVLYLDGKLRKKLDFGLKQIDNDNDVVGIISGDEGSGKSSLAGNIMRYISFDKFNAVKDMIGADFDDGLDKITNVKDKGWLMFDEGNMFFLSTEIMKREQRDLHKIFSIFRQKNLFVLIVLPSFFRLGTYFSLDRSKFLIRTYLKGGKRSYFAYHGEKNKIYLYQKGKKEHNYKIVKPQFRGRFDQCYLLENPAYKRFKLKTLTGSLQIAKKKKLPTPTEIKREERDKIIRLNAQMNSIELGKLLGIPDRTVRYLRKKLEEKDITIKDNEK